ncbi:uncharacterized protein N7483_000975 [Penicillium malachiteum]|uniref:uncharacterized protein n=1 Tax=Penicillium malachiteum TaxID=1324776 RepID=UPI0025491850|nr:uncharacterized protein N7483_000975 [Penicillium malachiteum]KAJ5735850.1 hypothetical protein N7483_000975 [Penicillium malachiteum]
MGATSRPEPMLWSLKDERHWEDEMDEMEVDEIQAESPEQFVTITNDQQIRLSIMTPRVLPATNSVNPYLQFWLPLSMNDRALFPALLSASLSHRVINGLLSGVISSRYSDDTPHLQACYKETISALNDVLRDPSRATTDETILAVLMTVEKPEIEMHKLWSQESPFQAPLQGLQWLNVHSAREPNLTHQNGLCRIIQLRGGLANIQTPGVAAAVF